MPRIVPPNKGKIVLSILPFLFLVGMRLPMVNSRLIEITVGKLTIDANWSLVVRGLVTMTSITASKTD